MLASLHSLPVFTSPSPMCLYVLSFSISYKDSSPWIEFPLSPHPTQSRMISRSLITFAKDFFSQIRSDSRVLGIKVQTYFGGGVGEGYHLTHYSHLSTNSTVKCAVLLFCFTARGEQVPRVSLHERFTWSGTFSAKTEEEASWVNWDGR